MAQDKVFTKELAAIVSGARGLFDWGSKRRLIDPEVFRFTIEARREKARELVNDGFSQREAAKLLGVDQKTISNDLRNNSSESEEKLRTRDDNRGPVRGTAGAGDNEWFTPPEYVAAARAVMGGIDLDPATHELAQEKIQAARFFTVTDDGLAQEWGGRVWLNPPYAQPLINEFVRKLLSELGGGGVDQAIMLTHNYTDTEWFQTAAKQAAMICFTRGRVRFIDPAGNEASPTQGQAFFYYGKKRKEFVTHFGRFGFVR